MDKPKPNWTNEKGGEFSRGASGKKVLSSKREPGEEAGVDKAAGSCFYSSIVWQFLGMKSVLNMAK